VATKKQTSSHIVYDEVVMTITYKPMDGFPNVKMPVLHTVVYAYTEDHVQAFYQRSYKDHLIDEWLKKNCRSPYYHSPGYLKEKFIQFEDDQEAMLFALRWS
jgi:hypothetical protein